MAGLFFFWISLHGGWCGFFLGCPYMDGVRFIILGCPCMDVGVADVFFLNYFRMSLHGEGVFFHFYFFSNFVTTWLLTCFRETRCWTIRLPGPFPFVIGFWAKENRK